jgi:hypothetical protein
LSVPITPCPFCALRLAVLPLERGREPLGRAVLLRRVAAELPLERDATPFELEPEADGREEADFALPPDERDDPLCFCALCLGRERDPLDD